MVAGVRGLGVGGLGVGDWLVWPSTMVMFMVSHLCVRELRIVREGRKWEGIGLQGTSGCHHSSSLSANWEWVIFVYIVGAGKFGACLIVGLLWCMVVGVIVMLSS